MSQKIVFHEFGDNYSEALQEATHAGGRKRALAALGGPSDYYRWAYRQMMSAVAAGGLSDGAFRVKATSLISESLWYRAGRPYYRIYPDYVGVFAATKLDVPVRFLQTPFPAYAVTFQVGAEPRYEDPEYGDLRVKALLVLFTSFADVVRRCAPDDPRYDPTDLAVTALQVRVGCVDPAGVSRIPSVTVSWADSDAGTTVAEKVGELRHRPTVDAGRLVGNADVMLLDMLSVALSTAFLATGGDKLIEPDVLNSDFAAYLAAVNKRDAAAAAALAAKAQRTRNGRPGFTVGRHEAILGRRADGGRDDEEVGGGCGLSHQHQRKGHFHKYWSGPDRDRLTVKWVKQLTVRPDLPLAPDYRYGERTLRSTREQAAILKENP